MRVSFTQGADGAGIATYTTDWHVRDGVRVYRRVIISRHLAARDRLTGIDAVEYRISHVERGQDGREHVLLSVGVSTFAAAIDVLGRELGKIVTAGFAHKADLERIPTARRPHPASA